VQLHFVGRCTKLFIELFNLKALILANGGRYGTIVIVSTRLWEGVKGVEECACRSAVIYATVLNNLFQAVLHKS